MGLPAINATVQQLMDALTQAAGNRHLGEHVLEKDPTIAKIVSGWPEKVNNERALQLQLPVDNSLEEIVSQYIDDYVEQT